MDVVDGGDDRGDAAGLERAEDDGEGELEHVRRAVVSIDALLSLPLRTCVRPVSGRGEDCERIDCLVCVCSVVASDPI
jgi:hypothetical protein